MCYCNHQWLPSGIIESVDFILVDLLVCRSLFSFSICSVFALVWLLPLLSIMVVLFGSSVVVSSACSSCSSDILSTCNFELFFPGVFADRSRISLGQPRSIWIGELNSKPASIFMLLCLVLGYFAYVLWFPLVLPPPHLLLLLLLLLLLRWCLLVGKLSVE